jgi:hypothetical protein
MNKDEALVEFLKGLRVAIHNSLAYQPDHPYFLKSAETFKQKALDLFGFLSPVKINVAQETLFFEGSPRTKETFSAELAVILHARKVKSLIFNSGIEVNELIKFLSFVSLQPKEIARRGGFSVMFKDAGIEHILVEELDYSRLLGSKGEASGDIWEYLFKDTVNELDPAKINEFAETFLASINNLGVERIIDDDALRSDLSGFIGHLKNMKIEKFSQCVQELSKVVLDSSRQLNTGEVAKLKEVFSELKENDFADILLSQLSAKKKLNSINFELFSQLAGKERLDNISSIIAGNKAWPKDHVLAAKKVQDLLSGPDSESISPAYRHVLSALVKDVIYKEEVYFDRQELFFNYDWIILSLLDAEKSREGQEIIIKRLYKDWRKKNSVEDYRFLKTLFNVAARKKFQGELALESFVNIEKWIAEFCESDMWQGGVSAEHIYLLDCLQGTTLSADDYLDKIFKENILNLYIIKRFFKAFSLRSGDFFAQLKSRSADLEFLNQAMNIFVQLNQPVSVLALKEIFSFGNEMVKSLVLKAMQRIKEIDSEFLLPLLTDKSPLIKKEAMAVLSKDAFCAKQGISILLGIPSPWGRKNALILENIRIVEALNLRESKEYLVILSKRRFFWNKEVRNRAAMVLRNWK